MNPLNSLRKALCLTGALVSLGIFAPAALAETEIDSFSMTPEQLAPGAALRFRIEGTPRAKASVRIGSIARTIPLKETTRGVYEGSYTVRAADKIAANNTVRATLRARGISATDSIRIPGYARAPTPSTAVISAFSMAPINRVEPGAELNFSLRGTPGGTASFSIPGVVNNLPMREVHSGQYEGSYTVRRSDNIPATLNVAAALEVDGRTVRSDLNQPLVADARSPLIRNLNPQNGETITAGRNVPISASFDDGAGVGVDPSSVRILLSGKDVTQHATISPTAMTLRADLQAGVYPVEVRARDLAGNSVRQAWQFTVAPTAASRPLPLRVTSHSNNAEISGGTIEIRGQTAPYATVDMEVRGVATLGGLFGVAQPVATQSVTADVNGNFAFNYQPQYAVPGARYDINLHARRGDLVEDLKLVLHQRR